MSRRRQNKNGMVLLIVLVCLVVATALLLAGVKTAISSHRYAKLFGRQVQAQWLLESGIGRAAAQLSSDAEYKGETWTISAEDIDGQNSGVVKIEVKPVADKTNVRAMRVEVDFPDDPQDRVRYDKELTIELP